ncbi:MAG: hypothetical protein M0Z82_07830 [Actinomycetota bacterium]|jgi:hypothetical protein|nr:hypothetical protein [Actinomycetota bacterium]
MTQNQAGTTSEAGRAPARRVAWRSHDVWAIALSACSAIAGAVVLGAVPALRSWRHSRDHAG